MLFYRLFLVLAVLVSSAYAKDNTAKILPVPQANSQQAHDFFTYLMKLGIIDTNIKTKCDNGEIIPGTTAYMQEPCASRLHVNYSCKDGKETYTAETKIDWHYVSKIELSGYNHNGEEIEISGNITTSHTKGIVAKNSKTKKGKRARKTKLTFDSPVTAKRALNALTLLKNKCDTSADHPF